MSKVHVLSADHTVKTSKIYSSYNVVIHTATPAGNNSVGFTWKAVGLSAGILGKTVMTVGTNPGQISSAESTLVLAGDIMEITAIILVENAHATPASIDDMANKIISDYQTKISRELKYFGYTQ